MASHFHSFFLHKCDLTKVCFFYHAIFRSVLLNLLDSSKEKKKKSDCKIRSCVQMQENALRRNFEFFQVMQKCNRITGLLATLLMEMLPGIRKYLDIHTLTLDVLPLLLNIMQPTLRPVSFFYF